MKKVIVRAMLSVALVGGMAAVAGVAVPTTALAAAPKGPSVSAAVGKQLQAASKAIQAKDFATAQVQLTAAKAANNRTPYDDFAIGQMQIAVSLNTQDLAGALAAVKSILDYPDIPATDVANLYEVALSLANQLNDTATATKAAAKLASLPSIDDNTMSELAATYYNAKDKANAKIWAQKSIDTAMAAHKPPNQVALEIQQNLANESHDMTGVIAALKQQVLYFNNKQDWVQLIGASYVKGINDLQVRDMRRLQILIGAPLDVTEYQDEAQMRVKRGYPGEALRVLQAGVSAGVVKSSDPLIAQTRPKADGEEKSLAASDAAGAKAASGELDTSVAEEYYGFGRYAEAEATAKRAIGKSGRKDPSEAPMVLGMAQAAQGKFAEAQTTFGTVPANSEAQKNVVMLWQLYCQTKLQPPAAAAPAGK